MRRSIAYRGFSVLHWYFGKVMMQFSQIITLCLGTNCKHYLESQVGNCDKSMIFTQIGWVLNTCIFSYLIMNNTTA